MTSPGLVVYGATGFSGQLIVDRLLQLGLRPVIGGRDATRTAAMGATLGLEHRVARLDDPAAVAALLQDTPLLLNAAGPFAATAPPLVSACVSAGCHYLDVTGESDVIEAVASRDVEARRAGIMLMPAAGFDVVASDCLAVHAAARVADPRTLRIGFDGPLTVSRGSMRSTIEQVRRGLVVRRNGVLVSVPPGTVFHQFDHGDGAQLAFAVNLGDPASAWYSTRIPNIESYLRATPQVWGSVTIARYWSWLLASPPWQAVLRAQADLFSTGPSEQMRRLGWASLVAEVTGRDGRVVRSRLRGPEVYAFTARSASAIAKRVLANDWKPGFQTPAMAFGADFVLEIDGVSRVDLA